MSKLDDYIAKVKQKYTIIVGFPKDAIYPPDDRRGHHDKVGQAVADVAKWNEVGDRKRNRPARPFMAYAEKHNKKEIKRIVSESFTNKALADPNRFEKIGIILVNMVRDSILHGTWKQNAPSTIRKKKSSRPLIDRGIMIKNVMYRVVKK